MAEKFIIEVYKEKNAEDITKLIADPESRLETGSAAAYNMAFAMAFICRAAAISRKDGVSGEELEYVERNGETLRKYMVHLIDEDVKSRNPMRQAIKKQDPSAIDATRQPAVSICSEIINMAGMGYDLALKLADACSDAAKPYLAQFAYTAMGASKTAESFIVAMSSKSQDETFRFVSKRQHELMLQELNEKNTELFRKLA